MKYLCLGYHDPRTCAGLSDKERQALRQEWIAFDQALRENGHLLAAQALEGDRATTTLHFEKGKVSIIPGPLDDPMQQLDGVLLLEADDLNHAIQLMSELPSMRPGGSLEIRPIRLDPLPFLQE